MHVPISRGACPPPVLQICTRRESCANLLSNIRMISVKHSITRVIAEAINRPSLKDDLGRVLTFAIVRTLSARQLLLAWGIHITDIHINGTRSFAVVVRVSGIHDSVATSYSRAMQVARADRIAIHVTCITPESRVSSLATPSSRSFPPNAIYRMFVDH